jgi:hypothetical protein
VAESERRIYEEIAFGEHQFKMLGYVVKQRAHLERSFRTAIDDMERSQNKRQARQAQAAQAAKQASAQAHKPAAPPPASSDHVMSEGADAHPASSAPDSPDTR